MKVLFATFVIFSTIASLHCQVPSKDENGQYVHDSSGQYVHDDSGRYVHDHSGDYIHDAQGGYLNDNSGLYRDDANGLHRNDRSFHGNDYFSSDNQKRINFANIETSEQNRQIGSTHLLGSGSTVNTQYVKPAKSFISDKQLFGNIAAAASPIPSVAKVKYDQGRYVDGHWKIIKQAEDIDTDGYHWEYETENGIKAEESGKVANKGTDKEGMKAKGFYQYTGPDKTLYSIGYTADENGFVAVGNHIPTPPPIPIEIQRSLEYLKSLGKL